MTRTVLWLSAHPEPQSLNGSLRDDGIQHLQQLGYRVVESDLYAMGWDPVVQPADAGLAPGEQFRVSAAVRDAYTEDRLPVDVATEQAKLFETQAVVVQFPLWWYGMPAILKGWFDRSLSVVSLQGPPQYLCDLHHPSCGCGGNVSEPHGVGLRNHQNVPVGDGVDVHKGQHILLIPQDMGTRRV